MKNINELKKDMGNRWMYGLKKVIQKNGFLYSSYKYVFERSSYYRNITKKVTDICIEAYPSSANTYLMFLVLNLNKDIYISHHTHTIANMKLAIKMNKPCVVVIRNPLDAISSYIFRFNSEESENNKVLIRAIDEYFEFYKFVQKNIENVYLVTFEDLIDNTSDVMVELQNYTNLELNIENIDMEVLINKSLNDVKNKAERKGRSGKGSVPSKSKEMGKKVVKNKIKNFSTYHESLELYNSLIKEG
ncbi:sulfotransferase domain-containing protein [Virgibacillus ihumii]|uniref:sulfotransferase domain-containing protein n=1 Tax=Virgibacillus ihumii TaxID=2686091 RepID=UPI00157C3AC0|nr:sulfotransferase domain-containing protein [Virgibacillus ihumii]